MRDRTLAYEHRCNVMIGERKIKGFWGNHVLSPKCQRKNGFQHLVLLCMTDNYKSTKQVSVRTAMVRKQLDKG